MSLRSPANLPALLVCALLVSALLAACASGAAMDAAYDQSLAPLKGASRAQLVAAWGQPRLEEESGEGKRLIYVVRHDFDSSYQTGGLVVASAGSKTAVVNSGGMQMTGAAPVACTTRFLLKEDHVVSWTFEGIGCGAPAQ